MGSGSGRRRVFARLDRQAVRAHLVDVNDGVIATAGVVEGLLAAGASVTTIVVAALGAMIGGGMALGGMKYSEAADERDAEIAVLAEERRLHELQPDEELAELATLYEDKGLSPALARQVAEELSTKDALLHHAEVEHGITLDDDSTVTRWHRRARGFGFHDRCCGPARGECDGPRRLADTAHGPGRRRRAVRHRDHGRPARRHERRADGAADGDDRSADDVAHPGGRVAVRPLAVPPGQACASTSPIGPATSGSDR